MKKKLAIYILGITLFSIPTISQAAETYFGAYAQGTTTIPFYGSRNDPYTMGSVVFDMNEFSMFTSITGANFIDLKLTASSTYQNNYVELVVCTSLVQDYDNWAGWVYPRCTPSSVIATSTQVKIQDFVQSGYKWQRFYFNTRWNFAGGAGTKLYFNLQPITSWAYNLNPYIASQYSVAPYTGLYLNKTTADCCGRGYYGTNIYYYPINYRVGYDDGASASSFISSIPNESATSTLFNLGLSYNVGLTDAQRYTSLKVDWLLNYKKDSAQVADLYYIESQLSSSAGTHTYSTQFEVPESGRIVVSGSVYGVDATGASSTPIFQIPQFGFNVGSSTQTRFTGAENVLGLAEDFTTSTSTDHCTFSNWSLKSCLKEIFWPSPADIKDLWGYATSTVLTKPPIGYAFRILNIFLSYHSLGTTTLTGPVFTVPGTLPGHGQSLNLSPWQPIRNFFYTNPSSDLTGISTTTTIWASTEPYFEWIVLTVFCIWFVFTLIKSNP